MVISIKTQSKFRINKNGRVFIRPFLFVSVHCSRICDPLPCIVYTHFSGYVKRVQAKRPTAAETFLTAHSKPQTAAPPKKQKLTDTAKAAAKMLCDSLTFIIPLSFFQALHNSAEQIPMRQLHIPPDRTHRPLLHLFRQEACWTVM